MTTPSDPATTSSGSATTPADPATTSSGSATDPNGTPVPRPQVHVRRESVLRERARRAVSGYGPPTQEFALPRRYSELSARVERQILDLVLRIGEALVTTGAPVAEVTAALLRLADGYGVRNLYVDITFDSISASIDREDESVTKMRIIRVRTSDYSRLAGLLDLVDDIAAAQLTLVEATRRLETILYAPHPYKRWIVTAALGLMAGAISMLLGGTWQVAFLAATTTIVIDRALRGLRRLGLPYIFQQAAGAAIATVVAIVLLWGEDYFGWDSDLLPPSLVVASGIVVLLAGMSLVSAAEDAISGYPLTAAAKSFEVAVSTIGLVAGIGFILGFGQRLGVLLRIGDVFGNSPAGLVQVACGAVIAGSWAVASYTRARELWMIMLVGGASAGAAVVAVALGLGAAGSSFFAAVVVGLLAALIGDRTNLPRLVVSVCGVTPLLPGLSIYAAMFSFVESSDVIGGALLAVRALSVGLALATGVTLGKFFAQPLRTKVTRWERRVAARARGARI